MGAYIDRKQALSHPFANGKYDHEHANEHFILGFESYREWLEGLPTIDLVTCGECKYYFPYKNYDGRILGYHCQAPNQQTDFLEPTHYCGFGERRTDEHNT